MHFVGAEFKARKRRKVDLISFDLVIKIKVIFPLTVTRLTPRNSVQKCMNNSTIFDNIMSANRFANIFARLLMKKYDILIFHKG